MPIERPIDFQIRILESVANRLDPDDDVFALSWIRTMSAEDFPNVAETVNRHLEAESRLSALAIALPKSGQGRIWDDQEGLTLDRALERLFIHAIVTPPDPNTVPAEVLSTLYDDVASLKPTSAHIRYREGNAEISALMHERATLRQNSDPSTLRDVETRLESAKARFDGLPQRQIIEDAIWTMQRAQGQSAMAAFAGISNKINSARLSTPTGQNYLSISTDPHRFDPREDHNWARQSLKRRSGRDVKVGKDTSRADTMFNHDLIDIELSSVSLVQPWFDPIMLHRDDYGYEDPKFPRVSDGSRFRRHSLIPGYVKGLILARQAVGLTTKRQPDEGRKIREVSNARLALKSVGSSNVTNSVRKATQVGLKKGKDLHFRIHGASDQDLITATYSWTISRMKNGRRERSNSHHTVTGQSGTVLRIPTLVKHGTEGGLDTVQGSLSIVSQTAERIYLSTEKIKSYYTRNGVIDLRLQHNRRIDIEVGVLAGLTQKFVPMSGVRVQFDLPNGGPETSSGCVGELVSDTDGRIVCHIPVSKHLESKLVLRFDAMGMEPQSLLIPNLQTEKVFRQRVVLALADKSGNIWDDTSIARIVGIIVGRLPTLPVEKKPPS